MEIILNINGVQVIMPEDARISTLDGEWSSDRGVYLPVIEIDARKASNHHKDYRVNSLEETITSATNDGK